MDGVWVLPSVKMKKLILIAIPVVAVFALLAIHADSNYRQMVKAQSAAWVGMGDDWYLRLDGKSAQVKYYADRPK